MLGLEDVSFSYGRRRVLDGASLAVPAGKILALLGTTGSGKSTALRLLAGLETPARGRVLVGGQAVAGDGHVFVTAERRNVAMVFQSLALWPHMTVAESLRFVLASRLAAGQVEGRLRALLAELEVANLADRRPAELSGGQAALAAVARALAQDPRALLLDEPFSGLDADLRDRIRETVFGRARQRSLATVYVTHLREEALASADLLAVIHGGAVAQCAPPGEVYSRPATAAAARLTGEVGLVPAEITAANVVTPAGAFARSLAPRADGLGTGWKGLAAFRPGNLSLAGDGELGGRVLSAERRGDRWRLGVAVGPGGARLPVDAEKPAPVGAEVRLALRGDLALVAPD